MKALKTLLSACFQRNAQPQHSVTPPQAPQPVNPNHYSTNYRDYSPC